MPFPVIIAIGAAVVTGVAGLVKGVEGAKDMNEAKSTQETANRRIEEAQESIEKQKNITSNSIQKLGKIKLNIMANEMNDFVTSYQKIKNVNLSDSVGLDELRQMNFSTDQLSEMKDVSIKAIDVLGSLGTGAGAGVLLGWGTYGGVMALGTASTGTAIGSLSGIAATNATLAWLGGGSLAAGGGGMAMGSMVLGGLIAGPALLIAGGLFSAKAKEQLNQANANLSESRKIKEELAIAEGELRTIANFTNELCTLTDHLTKTLQQSIRIMSDITDKKTEWSAYTLDEKKQVATAVQQASFLKKFIDTPLLTVTGMISSEIKAISAKLV